MREEVYFTKKCIIVRGKMTTRGKAKVVDYILFAIIEAKDATHKISDSLKQAL